MSTVLATTDRSSVTALPAPANLPAVHADASDILANPAMFEHMQRVAKVFCASALVPEHLRKNIADAFLALAIAKRMGEDPVMVMQNIYVVSGRAGWSAQYMIARANRSGVFKGPIRWRTEGKGDAMEVSAVGKLHDGEEVTASVSMAMAAAEGWTRNSKYKTMPEHMLRWRSATMLIRLYCPEVMMGMPSDDEIRDVTPMPIVGSSTDISAADRVNALIGDAPEPTPETVTHDGEIVEEVPPPVSWLSTATGRDAILRDILAMFPRAASKADCDAIIEANGDFLGKLTAALSTKVDEAYANRVAEIADAARLEGGK